MKRYEFKLVIHEGSDEFWESIEEKTGCDEVTEWIKDLLANGTTGLFIGGEYSNCELKLIRYSDGDE